MLSLAVALTLPAMSATNTELEEMLIKFQKDFAEYKVTQGKKISSLEKQLSVKSGSKKSTPKPRKKKTTIAQKNTDRKPLSAQNKTKQKTLIAKNTKDFSSDDAHATKNNNTYRTTHDKAEKKALIETIGTKAVIDEKAVDDFLGYLNPERGGFRVATTPLGTMNISLWTYARYLNSLDYDGTYRDGSGNLHDVYQRNDIQLSKISLQFKGWIFDEHLNYLVYVWINNNSMGQGSDHAFAGNMEYSFENRLKVGAGMQGLPTSRAMELMHPRLNRVDVRSMTGEFFRGSYSTGIWLEGEPVDDLYFRTVLANNLSQLGVDAGQMDNRLDTWSTGVWWSPNSAYMTEGMLWNGGGYGDFENHQTPAFRLGAHYTMSTEDETSQPAENDPENTQIRLSDGRVIFKSDIFRGAQLDELDYKLAAVDAGVKYKGFALEGEFHYRYLDNFKFVGYGNPVLGFDSLTDTGFSIQPSYMILEQELQMYGIYSKIWGEYGDPYEATVGFNWFPFGAANPKYGRQVRINADAQYTDLSPIGNYSLPYSVGGHGWVYGVSAELWF